MSGSQKMIWVKPGEALQEAIVCLQEAGVPEPELDAWYLMEDSLEMDRTHFLLKRQTECEFPEESWQRFQELLRQRAGRIPVQQLLGHQEFMGLDFLVNEHVLIPRQDTEILVEQVLEDCRGRKGLRLLDLCTGSGCILLSLLKLGDFAEGLGVDLSPEALQVAEENGHRLQVPVQWVESDLLTKVPSGQYDVIVSNPPYISGEELEMLQPEVREHEPRMALYAPENGLAFYRRLAVECRDWLVPGGRIYFEIGCRQAASVSAFLSEQGYRKIRVIRDLAGLDRVVAAVWPGKE